MSMKTIYQFPKIYFTIYYSITFFDSRYWVSSTWIVNPLLIFFNFIFIFSFFLSLSSYLSLAPSISAPFFFFFFFFFSFLFFSFLNFCFLSSAIGSENAITRERGLDARECFSFVEGRSIHNSFRQQPFRNGCLEFYFRRLVLNN